VWDSTLERAGRCWARAAEGRRGRGDRSFGFRVCFILVVGAMSVDRGALDLSGQIRSFALLASHGGEGETKRCVLLCTTGVVFSLADACSSASPLSMVAVVATHSSGGLRLSGRELRGC
jgi:hypothetical protein